MHHSLADIATYFQSTPHETLDPSTVASRQSSHLVSRSTTFTTTRLTFVMKFAIVSSAVMAVLPLSAAWSLQLYDNETTGISSTTVQELGAKHARISVAMSTKPRACTGTSKVPSQGARSSCLIAVIALGSRWQIATMRIGTCLRFRQGQKTRSTLTISIAGRVYKRPRQGLERLMYGVLHRRLISANHRDIRVIINLSYMQLLQSDA